MVKLAVERRSKFKESRLLWQSYWSMAVESRSRLEDSRLLWQFYWNMAEEEASSGREEAGHHTGRLVTITGEETQMTMN
jgi:hypothetical protein